MILKLRLMSHHQYSRCADTLSVSEETRERVLEAIATMGYQPKSKKREIGRYKLSRVGIIAYGSEQVEMNDPYYMKIRVGVEKELHRLGFDQSVLVQWSDNLPSYQNYLDLDGVDCVVQLRDLDDRLSMKRYPLSTCPPRCLRIS